MLFLNKNSCFLFQLGTKGRDVVILIAQLCGENCRLFPFSNWRSGTLHAESLTFQSLLPLGVGKAHDLGDHSIGADNTALDWPTFWLNIGSCICLYMHVPFCYPFLKEKLTFWGLHLKVSKCMLPHPHPQFSLNAFLWMSTDGVRLCHQNSSCTL